MPTSEQKDAIIAQTAAKICEVGALCGWPGPECKSREAAEALYDAGLLRALSAAEGVKPREDAHLESQYRAGYKAGWNAAHSDNAEEKYQAAMRYEGHLSALEGE